MTSRGRAPPPAAPAEPDMASRLEELAKLKEQGILTEEESQAKKKQILDLSRRRTA